jgi:branched-chain amino acid transport system ATP-binding protein
MDMLPTDKGLGMTALRGALECSDVQVSYGGVVALKGVEINIPPQGVVGLVGPNGSGKTTLLNAISGLQPIRVGRITFEGRVLDGVSADGRARLGISRTFQANRLFDTLSVLDNLLVGADRLFRSSLMESTFHLPRARAEGSAQKQHAKELVAAFGDRLLLRLSDQVTTLSYANRRRLEIARALMGMPSLLLLDEPSAGMNPHETMELAEQLPGLAQAVGCSMLIVEHKLDFIAHLCETVYVLDHGICIASGRPAVVQQEPAVVEAFLGGV